MSVPAVIGGAVASVGIFAAILSSTYIIDEGRVGVITYMGKAERQEKPAGLKFKAPFIAGVREFDVRERSLELSLTGATSNQLATTAEISVNWRPDPDQIMAIFVQYGGPDEFAANVIRTRLSQSAKATLGAFSSVQLTRERNAVAEAMLSNAIDVLSGYPVIISSVQIDNFSLPERYWEAVLKREEQREITEREKLLLQQQKLQAQQHVQTAEAERDATRAAADGQAYKVLTEAKSDAEAIRLKGEAEAEAIALRGEALDNNPTLVEYERVKSWNGVLPSMVMGDQPSMLMQMPAELARN